MRTRTSIKTLGAILAAVIAFSASAACISAEEMLDITDRKDKEAISVVCGLGIMEETDFGVFSPDEKVTRGDAAVFVARMMNYEPNDGSDLKFGDVPVNVEESGYISVLYGMGIMNGYSDTWFGFSDNITYDQFVDILMRVTGYKMLSNLMSTSEMVNRSELLKGLSVSGGELTRAEVAQLIYNCLSVETIEYTGTKNISKGETILESRLKLKKIKGVVNANSVTYFTRGIEPCEGIIEIDRIQYKCETVNADDMLGYPVVAYYDTESGGNEIKYIYVDDNKVTETYIEDEDIYDISMTNSGVDIKYYEKGRQKSASFGTSANVIYNGTAISEITPEILNVKMGNVRIIETDSGIVTIIINQYENYIAGYVNVSNNTIQDKFDRRLLNLDYEGHVKIYKFGYEIGIEEIKPGEVVSVYDNNSTPRFIRVYVSDDTEVGTLESLDDSGNAVINGKRYRAAYGVDLSQYIGKFKGTFYLDSNGRIAGVDSDASMEPAYGYLIKTQFMSDYIDISGYEDDLLTFKILAEDGSVKEYKASDKISINNQRVYKDWDNFPISYFRENGKYKSQLVKYQLDYEGKVTRLYTEGSEDGPQMNTEYSSRKYRRNSGGLYSTNTLDFFVGGETIIFSVPDEYSDDNGDYKVDSVSSLLEMESYICKSYDTDEYSFAKVMLMSAKSSVDKYSHVFMVKGIMSLLNSDNEIAGAAEGLYQNSSVQYEIKEGLNIKKGDILQIALNTHDKITGINTVTNVSEISDIIPKDDFHNDFACGVLWGVKGNYIRLNFTNGTSLAVNLKNTTQYYKYDSKKDEFQLADKASMEIGKYVFIKITTGYAVDIIVID